MHSPDQAPRQRWHTAVLAAAFLLAGTAVGLPAPAAADIQVKVKITIERIEALDSIEEPGDADWYVVSTIDGQQRSTDQEAHVDDDDISPDFELSAPVDLSDGSVPVVLEVWDDDDGFLSVRGDDDQADITSGPGRDLELTVDLAPCSVGGQLTSPCGTTITTEGAADDDNARLRFRVEVEEPPSAPGLNVRCTHTPLAPEPGDTVTVTVQALDGALAVDTIVAEQIELWTGNTGAAQTASGNDDATFTLGPVSGPDFVYGCRVVDEGVPVFTGFRRVGVGVPDGAPVPVLYTGPPSSRLDLVFIADAASYGDSDSAVFEAAAGQVLAQAYYDYDVFLRNQDKFNFWIAPGAGSAEDFTLGCDHTVPAGYTSLFAFADSGVLLHANTLRDCAPGGLRLFSSEPGSTRTVRHETGHRPFGLADEYCNLRPGSTSTVCDGGYFQTDELPNVYESLGACQADAPALGRAAADCQTWTSTRNGEQYWTSEPVNDDLMVDNTTPRAADTRRIDWLFGKCTSAQC